MHEIKLYGPIGGMFGTSAEEFLDQIPEGGGDITLRIHSPGGSVGDGLAMHNALRDYSEGKVIAVIDGYAASSASFVMLAADEVRVHESSLVFLHKPWSFADVLIDDPEAELEVAALLEFSTKLQGAIMSTQKTRKDIQSELEASILEVEAIKVSAKAEFDEVQAALENSKLIIDERDAEVLAVKQSLVEAVAEAEASKEIIADATAKVDELTAAAEAHDATVSALESKLADPAYIDASKVDAQVDVQADAPKTIGEQYNKMEQGQARRDFWNDNRRAILNDVEKDNDNA